MLFEDRPSGPLIRAVQVERGLRDKGFETCLVFPGSGSDSVAPQVDDSRWIRLETSRLPRLQHPVDLVPWSLRAIRDVARFVAFFRAESIDLVHVNGAAYVTPAIAARLTGVPLVWHLNDTALPPKLCGTLGNLVSAIADVVVVAAAAVAEYYGIAADRSTVVHAPVDVSLFKPRACIKECRSDAVRVGIVANWNPLKDIATFLRALARLRSDGLDVRGVIAGARLDSHVAYAATIDAAIDDLNLRSCVDARGFVSDVPKLMATLDALVLSSRSEASPMSVLEAMAAAVPVVATDVGAVREMLCVSAPPAGVVVPVGGYVEMAEALRAIIADPEVGEQMGRAGRRIAIERFSLEACVDKHFAVYNRALNLREAGDDVQCDRSEERTTVSKHV